MNNTFGWVQLTTTDPEKAKNFYGKLFNWTLTPKEMHCDGQTQGGKKTYIEVDAGNGPCAGIAQGQSPNESHWVPFVSVNDIHESTEKAEKLGAQIVLPAMNLGGDDGFITVFIDPTGAVLGIHGKK